MAHSAAAIDEFKAFLQANPVRSNGGIDVRAFITRGRQ
jgi:hypothetical protein